MIKFIICDDNITSLKIACNSVNKVLMNYNIDYKIIKFLDYNKELKIEINKTNETKVYILDIELPSKSGLEIASEIRENDDDSIIIFETVHPECKDDIFYSRLEVLDFISKEYLYEERLEDTIKHIIKKIYKNKSFSFTYNRNYYRFLLKEVNYIEKEQLQNRCVIYLTNGDKKIISDTITNIKNNLLPTFFQSHKSCLINLDNVKYIDYKQSVICFKNGDKTNLLTTDARKELRNLVN